MSAKDKYGNNIRRGDRVKNVDSDEGEVISTTGHGVVVKFDNGEEDRYASHMLTLCNNTMGRRGK